MLDTLREHGYRVLHQHSSAGGVAVGLQYAIQANRESQADVSENIGYTPKEGLAMVSHGLAGQPSDFVGLVG